jgi:hypothetical protein
VAAWHHADTPHQGITVTMGSITPYTTSVDDNVAKAGEDLGERDLLTRPPVDCQRFHIGGDGLAMIAEAEINETEHGKCVGCQQAGTGLAAEVQRAVAVTQGQVVLPQPGVD